MIFINLLTFLPALAGLAADTSAGQGVRRVTVREEVTIRVPIRPRPGPHLEWREKRGPRCIAAGSIKGAMLSGRNSVDFIMRDRSRLRARLESNCLALDFYDGFYVQPEDHRLCMRRDVIRSRWGSAKSTGFAFWCRASSASVFLTFSAPWRIRTEPRRCAD